MKKEQLSTSTQEEPKVKLALEEKYKEQDKKEEKKQTDLSKKESSKLPEPTGWRLLVLPFKMKERTKGGLYLGQETIERQQVGSNCGMVLKMGAHCYDKERYPEGPWCKKGDWVIFARYAGSRLPIEGGEVRILNDDEVLGTIKDPESVLHNV